MDFSGMQDMVITTTKRPDRLEQIKNAINNACSVFSLGATFQADLVEGTVAVDGTVYAQSFSITTEFTRFRRLLYLKRTGQRGYLSMVSPLKVFDNCGNTRKDTWYRAGDNIVFNPAILTSTLEYGYYQVPAVLVDDTDTYWMLDIIPFAVFNAACAEVFRGIGEIQDAQFHKSEAERLYDIARNDLELGGTPVSA